MSRRFSPQLLFELRNHIPIDVLIENVLAMPTTGSEKYFRFSCPICSGFHTAVNPGENLARCFDCQKNFNPIDMVMCRQKIGFAQSVRFLRKLAASKPERKSRRPRTAGANAVVPAIGQILSQMASTTGKPCPEETTQTRNILRRIEILEQKVALLLQLSSPR